MRELIPTTNDEGLDKELTVEEAAEYMALLGLTDHAPHPETVRKWLRSGKLRGYKDSDERGRGGQWKITLGNLLAFDPGKSKGKQGRPPKGGWR